MVARQGALVTAYLFLGSLTGCTKQMIVHASPVEAVIELPDGEVLLTPTIVSIGLRPFVSYPVLISAPGYRSVVVDLAAEQSLWSLLGTRSAIVSDHNIGAQQPDLTVVLIPTHPPVGGSQ